MRPIKFFATLLLAITPLALRAADVPIHNMTDTWTDAGTEYDAIKMNVTNTNSAAGSDLIDLQIGGTSYFRVAKTGQIVNPIDNYGLMLGEGQDCEVYYDGTDMVLKPATVGSGGVKVLSTDESNYGKIAHDNTDLYIKTDDGNIILQTDEATNTTTVVSIKPKGTSEVSELELYDTDGERLSLYTAADRAFIASLGGDLGIIPGAGNDVAFFEDAASGETPELFISGYKTGDSKQTAAIGMSVDVAGILSFDACTIGCDGGLRAYQSGFGDYVGISHDGTNANYTTDAGRHVFAQAVDTRGGAAATLGSDLVTNGTFDADSDWVKGTGWAIGAGVATKTAGTGANLSQDCGEAAGLYQITFDYTRTAGTLTVSCGGVTHSTSFTSASASVEIYIRATGTGNLTFLADASFAGTVDNVTLKLITPNAASLYLRDAAGTEKTAIRCTGSYNNALGAYAQQSLTTGTHNNALGNNAQLSLTTGLRNNALGYAAQYSLTTGSYNNALGAYAQQSLTTGTHNNALGNAAQYSLTTGSYNNALGDYAQQSLTTGTYNNALGYYAGCYAGAGTDPNQTSTYSMWLGDQTRASADGVTNENVLGSAAIGKGSNTFAFGSTAITNNYFRTAMDLRAAAGAAGTLNLCTEELTVEATNELGAITFQAPLESSATDAVLVAGKIASVAMDTFAADNNQAALVFGVAKSAAASEKMRLYTADDASGVLRLSNTSATIANTNTISKIEFMAPNESDANDAILPGAFISAVAEADYDATGNETAIVFATGTSETAAEKVRIKNTGEISALHGVVIGTYQEANWIDDATHGAASTTMYLGNETIDTTASDVRLKENIEPTTIDAMAILDQLRVVDFDWKTGERRDRGRATGLIAQEVIDVLPSVVIKGKTETDNWAVEYHHLVPILIQAIKVQQSEIEQLKRSNVTNPATVAMIGLVAIGLVVYLRKSSK